MCCMNPLDRFEHGFIFRRRNNTQVLIMAKDEPKLVDIAFHRFGVKDTTAPAEFTPKTGESSKGKDFDAVEYIGCVNLPIHLRDKK